MSNGKAIGAVILIVIGLTIITFLATGADLAMFKFWAPKYENARREVFEQTKSYNQAKLQELAKFKLEYDRGNYEDKAALKSVIVHKFADYDVSRLPHQLQLFVEEIRGY